MSTIRYSAYAAVVTLMDSLVISAMPSNAWAMGAAYWNQTEQKTYADLELVLNGSISTGASPCVDLYNVPSMDLTNYPNPPGTSAVAVPSTYYVGTFGANPNSYFARGAVTRVPLVPGKNKFYIQNRLGNALPAGNNTLLLYGYTDEIV